jgi:hypothetical protein
MRSSIIPKSVFLLLIGTALVGAALAAGNPERKLQGSWKSAELGAFRFDISVAELEVRAGASDQVEVEIFAVCDSNREDCAKALEKLALSERRRGTVLVVELDGYPKWGKDRFQVEAIVSLPARLDFELDMGVGEVTIEGLTGNLDLEVGVGEVTLDSQSAHVRSVNLDVGVGDAEIYGSAKHIEGRRSFLVGSEVYWAEGKGDKRIKVDVGVGEATVRLD